MLLLLIFHSQLLTKLLVDLSQSAPCSSMVVCIVDNIYYRVMPEQLVFFCTGTLFGLIYLFVTNTGYPDI